VDDAAPAKPRHSEGALQVVTLSYSSSVLAVLSALQKTRPIAVSASESRPALEGRRLAIELATGGVPVTIFSDSAIAHALDSADVVMVGADAVAPAWFLNKSGTRMLAAAAAQCGVPVYVIATRDKFVGRQIADGLVIRSGGASEIWDDAPPAVEVRNPYFELTSLDLVTAVISDVGILGTGMVPDVCEH
jgi:translation initiation factor 2B subunit (eIF-2B alpha/beta/delta family)